MIPAERGRYSIQPSGRQSLSSFQGSLGEGPIREKWEARPGGSTSADSRDRSTATDGHEKSPPPLGCGRAEKELAICKSIRYISSWLKRQWWVSLT
jgi:hypothetical protein